MTGVMMTYAASVGERVSLWQIASRIAVAVLIPNENTV